MIYARAVKQSHGVEEQHKRQTRRRKHPEVDYIKLSREGARVGHAQMDVFPGGGVERTAEERVAARLWVMSTEWCIVRFPRGGHAARNTVPAADLFAHPLGWLFFFKKGFSGGIGLSPSERPNFMLFEFA